MGLAAVRDLRSPILLNDPEALAALEVDLLSEYAMARAAATISDAVIRRDVSVISETRQWLDRPLWEMQPQDMDRFLVEGQRGNDPTTKANKARTLAVFFEFLELRHAAEIHIATGHLVTSPIDEINRPKGASNRRVRIPPTTTQIDSLFTGWQNQLSSARKYGPMARNYTAMRLASLIGPRISELCLLNIDDIHWDLGEFGKVLLRGKASRGKSGKKERLAPLINGSRDLLEWWVTGPRWDFDDRVDAPGAPLFPSERRLSDGSSARVGDDALRDGLKNMVALFLPSLIGTLSPHLLRHFAASELYNAGMDIVAVQELLGHSWLQTTMIYVHPQRNHIEKAWMNAGARAAARFGGPTP
ncbi:tyrosine-type recombinase/integrase [Streptomyces sp. NBC_01005]|uniref:tyrosine-type recombinase/integrase n=1 Tax=unclassified Streptomyces TaxID=2593676 RepID=UPI00386C123C|nr:tyrosine-type recombinase/integrase [Streptomyces sp. NBC_01005]WTC99109.1 tyrosine-type recombinase/integrase [Streptomyces sp. NBC_01650]